MNQKLALRLLGEVMEWDDDRAREEYAWLDLMSHLKYDAYEDFSAGARFIERLIAWIQQFNSTDRECAYSFVREDLLFISKAQIHHLIELLYPEFIRPFLENMVAQEMKIKPYQVRSTIAATQRFKELLRATLFIGLSDGARMDDFRRANVGRISNEQVTVATHIDKEKWDDLLSDLRESSGNLNARFSLVFLIDDFIGSGKTLLRQKPNSQEWTGRMARVRKNLLPYLSSHFEENWTLYIHHYIATVQAQTNVPLCNAEAEAQGSGLWFRDVEFTYSMVLPEEISLNHSDCGSEFCRIIENESYYDPSIETQATDVGGTGLKFGFNDCGLPLVLEHNTPNNSVALLWAESQGDKAMGPLFRRRQRHF